MLIEVGETRLVKRARTRQVLDYIQVPPRPPYLIHCSKPSSEQAQQTSTLRMASSGAAGDRDQIKRKKRFRSASPTSSADATFSFVLSEEERSSIVKPTVLSPKDSPEAYLKWSFYIDLARVPGRKPPPSFQTGK